MAGGYCGVSEVEFDDLTLPIKYGVYAGSYSGIAEVDGSGAVVAVNIHGYDQAGEPADILIERKFSGLKSSVEKFADEIGQRIETVYAALIAERVSDWRDSMGVREFEAAE